MGALELLQQRNREAGKPFAASSWPKICLVTCDDPSLTGQLEWALGLGPGDAVVIRVPAAGGAMAQEWIERAVAKAVYVNGCDEVLVLSHSACSLYELPTSKIIEALGRHRVPRSAVPMDLRELVGAGRDPRESVRMTAETLRQCPYLPEGLLVHLGHLEETTGDLLIVEDGEKYRVRRTAEAGPSGISGYTAGPTELSAVAEAQPLPQLADFQVQALAAPGIPEIKPFENQIISVTLPSLTTEPHVSAPHTAQSLMGGEATAGMESRAITSETLFGEPAKEKPEPRRGKQKARPSGEQLPPLKPALVDAIQKVRIFMGNEIPKPDRRETLSRLAQALESGAPSEELVKVALKPVLQAGQNRYKVIDEMILVKEEVVRFPPAQAARVLQSMVP